MDESDVKLLFFVEIMPAINDRQRENWSPGTNFRLAKT